jgi:hypothetical protein
MYFAAAQYGEKGRANMDDSAVAGRLNREFHELIGALDAISALKEELELRLDEARDDCVREVLDNVIALVGAHIIEYQHRRSEQSNELGLENLNESEM